MVSISRYSPSLAILTLGGFLAFAPIEGQTQTQVLWLGGGTTSHDPAAMRDLLVPVFAQAGLTVSYHTDEAVLNSDSLKRYDVLFIYNAKKGKAVDGNPDLTAAQEDALLAWVRSGHGIVGVHSANSSYLANPRYLQMFGGEFTVHGDSAAYKHITIVNPTHPAIQGTLAPPEAGHADYWDEGRVAKFTKNDTVMLARALANGAEEPWTWVRPEGNGWVYYTSSGHDQACWSDRNFQGQLIQALKWGASLKPVSLQGRLPGFAKYPVGYGPLRIFTADGSRLPARSSAGIPAGRASAFQLRFRLVPARPD